jgi:hypothetical protein
LREGLVNGIIGLGEGKRQIPFIHAGREMKFPVCSLFPGQDLHILGRIRRFLARIRKIPCKFRCSCHKDGNAGRRSTCFILVLSAIILSGQLEGIAPAKKPPLQLTLRILRISRTSFAPLPGRWFP